MAMSNYEIEMQPEELLTAICGNLHRHFFKIPKNEAKNRFRELKKGDVVSFLTIGMPEQGEIDCKLALDHSRFIGRLNYSQFRNALAMHLHRVADKLTKNENLNIFTSQDTGDMIFHIPGIVESGDTVNILVTCVEQRAAGKMTVRLVFLDPGDFPQNSS
jgi:hypothetical protein